MDPLATPQPPRKWFWLGIILCFVAPPVPGLIYGAFMLTEKNSRRDALVIIAWALLWFAVVFSAVHYFASSRNLPTLPNSKLLFSQLFPGK